MTSRYVDFNCRTGPAILVLFVVLSAFGRAQEFVAGEEKARAQVAKPWLALATWCHERRARGMGLVAVHEAQLWDPASPLAKTLDKTLTALPDAAPADPDAAAARVIETKKAAAIVLDRLLLLKQDAKSVERFEGYLFQALEWDPVDTKRLARLRAAILTAIEKRRFDAAARLLARAKDVDQKGAAAGRYEDPWRELARMDVAILRSADPPFAACIALPEDWKPGGSYDVLVAVEGAGCNFLGAARSFREARKKRPLIVVVPQSLSNTNTLEAAKYPFYSQALLDAHNAHRIRFDGEGLKAILAGLRSNYGATPRHFMTGFSGGGQLTWWWTFQLPEELRGSAPACGNFSGAGLENAKAPPEGGPPVRILLGEKDEYNNEVNGQKPGILGQTALAEDGLARLGFTRVNKQMVPGTGHSNMAALVMTFIDEVNAKR